jgi:hypothetical protein
MISPTSDRGVSTSVSCVNVTPPSIEFSIGTTPTSASWCMTLSNTAGIDGQGTNVAAPPKWASAAS